MLIVKDCKFKRRLIVIKNDYYKRNRVKEEVDIQYLKIENIQGLLSKNLKEFKE